MVSLKLPIKYTHRSLNSFSSSFYRYGAVSTNSYCSILAFCTESPYCSAKDQDRQDFLDRTLNLRDQKLDCDLLGIAAQYGDLFFSLLTNQNFLWEVQSECDTNKIGTMDTFPDDVVLDSFSILNDLVMNNFKELPECFE